MGQMIGASPAELRELAAKMRADADRLDQIRNDLGASFRRTHWEGGDGDEIRANWTFRWSGQLGGASIVMQSAANTLCRNADQQELASGSDGGARPGLLSLLYGGAVGDGSGDDSLFEKFDLFNTRLSHTLLVKDILHEAGKTELGKDLLSDGRRFIHGDSMIATDARRLFRPLDGVAGDVKSLWTDASKYTSKPWKFLTGDDDVAKWAKDTPLLENAGHLAKAAGALAFVGVGIDVVKFAQKPSVVGAVDLAFDGAEIATAECPPLSIAIGVAHWAFDTPQIRNAVIDGAKAVGSAVAQTAVAEVKLGENAVHAVTNIASSGVNAVKHFLHW